MENEMSEKRLKETILTDELLGRIKKYHELDAEKVLKDLFIKGLRQEIMVQVRKDNPEVSFDILDNMSDKEFIRFTTNL